jgi:hypothetical protein
MAIEPAQPPEARESLRRDRAQAVERRVQARHVVALRREEDVPIGMVEPELADVQVLVEEVDDNVEGAEARPEVPRACLLDRDQRVQPADVREQREPSADIVPGCADAVDIALRDECQLLHAERR